MSLSHRMKENVEIIMPKIASQVAQRSSNSPPIDLGTAENWLIRTELVGLFAKSISKALAEQDLSYQKGFAGDPLLIAALADLFNEFFVPCVPVVSSHVVVGPGGAAVLDSLLSTICDAGESMLVLAPFWSGFHFQFSVRPQVKIIPVHGPVGDLLNPKVVQSMRIAQAESTSTVRGVVICNPQNPLGLCYSRNALEEIARYCEENDLHLVSDEIYALSTYESVDVQDPIPFTSILHLDLPAVKVSPSRVHVIWSPSKDFGCSGLRLGALVSQSNPALATGVALACNTQVSSLTAIAITALLRDRVVLHNMIALNKKRLAAAYVTISEFLRAHGIQFISTNAGVYVWARLSNRVESWEQEAQLQDFITAENVAVSAGKSYASPQPGWFRLSFAIGESELDKGLKRLIVGINAFNEMTRVDTNVLALPKTILNPEIA